MLCYIIIQMHIHIYVPVQVQVLVFVHVHVHAHVHVHVHDHKNLNKLIKIVEVLVYRQLSLRSIGQLLTLQVGVLYVIEFSHEALPILFGLQLELGEHAHAGPLVAHGGEGAGLNLVAVRSRPPSWNKKHMMENLNSVLQ